MALILRIIVRRHPVSPDFESFATDAAQYGGRPVAHRGSGDPHAATEDLRKPIRRQSGSEGFTCAALPKLILEPIFEADFQPGSYGYRPKKSAHTAIRRVSDAIVEGKTYVIDLDLRSYFDTVRHHIVLEKVAQRVSDEAVLWLLRLLLKASGKQGVPQGGVISPLLSNVYLNEVDKDAGASEGSDP